MSDGKGRDDSVLYTGGRAVGPASPKREEAKKERSTVRKQLLPAAEIISEQIEKEIDEIQNIDYLNVEEMMTDEHFKAEMMARKKTIQKLRDIKGRLSNLLRDNKDEQPAQSEETKDV